MPDSLGKSVKLHIAILAIQLICLLGYSQKMPNAYYRAEAALELNDTKNALSWADSCFNAKPYRYQ
ncbi:MAG: hypothetical protein KBA42_09630, partial [Bacteroidales bacterium]|nr:hypothetical protein [Bacteroidales bacterium]